MIQFYSHCLNQSRSFHCCAADFNWNQNIHTRVYTKGSMLLSSTCHV